MAKPATTGKAVTKAQALPPMISGIKALEDPEKLGTLTSEFLKGGGTEFEMKRYRVPPGGIEQFSYKQFGEDVLTPEIEGVILCSGVSRSFWAQGFSNSGTPPDCSSADGVVGFGVLPEGVVKGMGAKLDDGVQGKGKGFSCSDCAYSQWGSAVGEDGEQGKGQRCKKVRAVFFLGTNDNVPSVIVCPPASLKGSTAFLNDFLQAGIPPYGLAVRATVKKHDGGPFPHGRVQFQLGTGKLKTSLIPDDSQAFEHLKNLAASVRSTLLKTFTIQPGDVSGQE